MTEPAYHIPALFRQSIDALAIRSDGVYIDATLGGAGHTRGILAELGPEGHLYSFDRDEEALANAPADPRLTPVHSDYRFVSNFMRYYGVEGADGLLADLGVSFHHFDDPERGFSFRHTGPLDMRMNRRGELTAAKYLETVEADELARVLTLYGELPQARRMAAAIAKARTQAPVDTVERLLETVKPLINPRAEKKELAQLFQALRIRVNDELRSLELLLEESLRVLKPGGRLAIITYHSLEDRLVKNFMKSGRLDGKVTTDFFGRRITPIEPLTAKPIVPDAAETEANPRSRSAKLRVAVRLADSVKQ